MTRILIACLSLALLAVSLAVFPLAADDAEREIDELRNVAEVKLREAQELSRAGNRDESRRLWLEAHELRGRAEDLERERERQREREGEGHEREGETAERQRLEERLLDARNEVRELWEAGRQEEAQRRRREVHELEQQLERAGRHHPDAAHHPTEDHPPHHERHEPHREELRRHYQHLRVAVENLHAAGRPELAREVARHAEQLERELHRHEERAPEHPPHLAHELREVRAQLERLQDQVHALRETVERLQDR